MVNSGAAEPDVAVSDDGSMLIIWSTAPYFGGGQVFASNGATVGPELSLTEPQFAGPAGGVTATPDGDFVVALSDFASGYLVRARRVSSTGSLEPSFAVSGKDSTNFDILPRVAAGADRSLFVVWYDEAYSQVLGRRFQNEQPTGEPFVVGEGFQPHGPRICRRSSDGFVVTWDGYGPDTLWVRPVQYRLYDASGALGPSLSWRRPT